MIIEGFYSLLTKNNAVNLIGQSKVISHYPRDGDVKFNNTEMAATRSL